MDIFGKKSRWKTPISVRGSIRKRAMAIKFGIAALNRQNRNIVIFIIYGLLYDTVLNIFKPLAVKYLERLGGEAFHISLYNSLPGLLSAAVLLPVIVLISGAKNKKLLTCVFIFISRLAVLSVAFIPFFEPYLRPIMFIVLISLFNLPDAVSQASMQSTLGSIFDGRVRATALSLRNKFGNLLILLVTLVCGLIITYLPKNNEERMFLYRCFFVAAFVIGLGEIFFFSRLKEENNPAYSPAPPPEPPKKEDFREIFRHKKFLVYALCTLTYYFCYHAGWGLSGVYIVKSLGATEIWLSIIAVVSGVMSFFSAALWSKLIHKKGNTTALVAACFIMGINTLAMVMSPNLYILLFHCLINGVGVIGINVTMLNGLIANTPDKNRILFIGVYNTLMNISLGTAPLVMQAFMDLTNIRTALFTVAGMRLTTAAVLWYILLVKKKAVLD